MQHFFSSLLLLFFSFIAISIFIIIYKHKSNYKHPSLPPVSLGLPFLGESLDFLKTGWEGKPQKFFFDRKAKYKSEVFKTNLFCQPTVVLCSAVGIKFLFFNDNKLVKAWYPDFVRKIFPSSYQSSPIEETKRMRKMLPEILKPEALKRYVGIMDTTTQKHFATHWENKQEVVVFPLAKRYTFELACRLFLSIEDPDHIARFSKPFNDVISGIFSLPIDLPGTSINRAIKASSVIRTELFAIIKQRKKDLADGKASPTQDILSHMLKCNENGQYMNELQIADQFLALLAASHDSAGAACTFTVKYLAELPHIYEGVYKEQVEIIESKPPNEMLNWNDIQKMKYSWNVVCEVLRLCPSFPGNFREVIHDFDFNGFSIPKGWKLYWNANSTHRNPEYFPEPEKFDPSRFEGNGPAPCTFIPFGGGPLMCPGKEYARLEILIFVHNLVKRFKFDKLILEEKIVYNPMPAPENGVQFASGLTRISLNCAGLGLIYFS